MTEDRALTVTEAVGLAKQALEAIPATVIGEVTQFKTYKAVYFTVTDGESAMDCMMWPGAYSATGVELVPGMLVEVGGRFSVYPPKGRMQFSVSRLAVAGEGALRMQVAALARALQAEGLMDPSRKRPLPRYPSRVAVVTSPRGKAVWDVIRTLRRRWPLAEVLVAGVRVEGADAHVGIIEGLRVAAEAAPDAIVLCRGGGSYEDLMPFNHEALARAVAACPVPVVTGIGHEPDTSIADMVSDLRASTPTAAAEAVAPCADDVAVTLCREARSLGRALMARLQAARHAVAVLRGRPVFADPVAVLGVTAQRLDLAEGALARSLPLRLERERDRVRCSREALVREGPRRVAVFAHRARLLGSRLGDLSPQATLDRGYAACFRPGGELVRAAAEVASGDAVVVRLGRGSIDCDVTRTNEEG